MLIYITLFSLIFLILLISNFFAENSRRKIFVYSTFIVLFLISGLRYGIGTDFFTYEQMFNSLSYESLDEPYYQTFAAYALLNIVLKNMGCSFLGLTLASAFITIFLIYVTIVKNSSHPRLSILIFIFWGFYFSSFNIIRQYIAIALIFYSYNFLAKSSYIKYLIVALLAGSFHISAFSFIPAMLIVNKIKINKKAIALIWISSLILSLMNVGEMLGSIVDFLPLGIGGYYDSAPEYFERNQLWKFKLILINVMAMFMIMKWHTNTIQKNIKVIKLFMASIVFLNIFNGLPILMRTTIYFDIFSLLGIPVFLDLFNKKDQIYVSTIIVLHYLIMTIITILILGQYGVVPYGINL